MTVPTVATRVRDWARRAPEGVALREKRLGIWQQITWSQYWEQVELVAHALRSLGVAPGDRVAVHSENRSEWFVADAAAVAARAVTVGVYPSNPAAEVQYLLADSGAKVLIAEDQEQVDKALEVKADTPELEWIVYLEPRGVSTYEDPSLLWWPDLLERGREHREGEPELLERLAAEVSEDDLVTLVYTSGTTGPPKGAMLTAGNVNFGIHVLFASGGLYGEAGPEDMVLSYLPQAHVADRAGSNWLNAQTGAQVHFAESIEDVQLNLREVQPSLFLAVPRIWEKLRATAEVRMASASPLKRLNYRLWMRNAAAIGRGLAANGGAHTLGTRLRYALGYPFLYRALRDRMGLRKCRRAVTGAAPIAPELLEWFFGLGVVIHEIYGMTENAAVATVNRSGHVKIGTVGEPQPGIELRLDESTGEVLTRHPGVFVGYWNKPERTAEALDPDGWLHTGDVGEWVDGTHVRIVDRIKDIMITAGGKNISPSEIENSLKFSPYVKEAVVIGDGRPYLTALVGIELDTVSDWAQRHRIPYTTFRDLSEKPEVVKLVQAVIDETNERLARPEQIEKFRMMGKELDHEDGELTATQKVKRAELCQKLGPLIEEMYAQGRSRPGEAVRR